MLVTLSEAVDGANEPTNTSWSITGGTNTNGVSIVSVTATDGENTAVVNLSGDLAASDALELTYTPGSTIVDSNNGNVVGPMGGSDLLTTGQCTQIGGTPVLDASYCFQ